MHGKRRIVAVFLSLCLAGVAQAATIRMDFRTEDSAGPIREITGTLIYEAESPTSRIKSLTSIDLVIDGHRYGVGEIGFISDWFDIYVMIGKMSPEDAINEVIDGTDDFYLVWNRTTHESREFAYASSRRSGAWRTPLIDLTFSIVAPPPPPAPVPIDPWSLVLAAMAIGVVARRELAKGPARV